MRETPLTTVLILKSVPEIAGPSFSCSPLSSAVASAVTLMTEKNVDILKDFGVGKVGCGVQPDDASIRPYSEKDGRPSAVG